MKNAYRKQTCIGLLACLALSSSIPAFAEEMPEITIVSAKVDSANFDESSVEAALDKYVSPRIGGHINLEFVEVERYEQVFSKYEVSDTLPDVFFSRTPELITNLWKQGKILDLSSLLDTYGSGIKEALGAETLSTHTDRGAIYGIPCMRDFALRYGFEYRVDIAEKYNLDMKSVKSFKDLTDIFAKLQEQAPDMIACCDVTYKTWDTLTDSLGVLMDYGQNSNVTNLYETESFEELYRYVNLWNQRGYLLSNDIGFLSANRYVSSPEIFGKFSVFHPGLVPVDSVDAGEKIDCIPLSSSFLCTDVMVFNTYAISASCPYPEICMKFLNLMYSDPYVMNLLTYGIEGEHYRFVDRKNDIIDFAQGVNRENSEYAQFRSYYWGNQSITHIWNGYPVDLWQQIQDYNESAPRSLAFGFRYDSAPVQAEVAACTKVVNTYLPLLEAGVGNVDEILEEFQLELRKAGIDSIIKEKQRQLNLFLSDKEEAQ